jgi:hypothetical protein
MPRLTRFQRQLRELHGVDVLDPEVTWKPVQRPQARASGFMPGATIGERLLVAFPLMVYAIAVAIIAPVILAALGFGLWAVFIRART